MQKIIFILFGISFFIISVGFIFAVGGGGEGSLPNCFEDSWECTDWTPCSPPGMQVRSCRITFECPLLETPHPPLVQACNPPPQPGLPPFPPVPIPPPPPSCSADEWECSAWSSSCDIYGKQNRSCKLALDCPGINTEAPPTEKPCNYLQCNTKPGLRDRILCRLKLAPPSIARELSLEHLPEECRVISANSLRTACINRYKSLEPCLNKERVHERLSCARGVLRLDPIISTEVKNCADRAGASQAACKTAIRDKIFSMIKFRFYDLEERGEYLVERGVADINDLADFKAIVELKTQDFNHALSIVDKRQIILGVRAAWKNFLIHVQEKVSGSQSQ